MRKIVIHVICTFLITFAAQAQQDSAHVQHTTTATHEAAAHGEGENHETKFNPGETAFHHISDQNVYSIGPWSFPLPCILYAPSKGLSMFSSSKFDIGHHGNGHVAYDGYVLHEGSVKRVQDSTFPQEEVHLEGFTEKLEPLKNKNIKVYYAKYNGNEYRLDAKSTMDGGFLGGGITSFYDFSITKNVLSMLLVVAFLLWVFISIAKTYATRKGLAPTGKQSLFEPIIEFIRDEVAKPFVGAKWEKYLPFLLAVFFFILGLNLFGQIPFLGNSNVTGNIAVTAVLALFTFFITNLNGNKHYWEHIVWMPGVPAPIKALIITPVEIMGLFIKPFTLMLRLFANITAGHMVILSFVGLIFIFGKSGTSLPGTGVGVAMAIPLSLFMMAIELLVAFIQAFVFTILTASYIGAAIEDHHKDHH
ncbi:MAG: F0F1 ATP synthase subunit A [Saprospiraceae bacterium]|nr:F0F1 ATP synthase subunit A [Saprospiraceae bacterium]MBP7679946.1 F0F1 ATP synthase subunit A [Saprospiraceae bacterium]